MEYVVRAGFRINLQQPTELGVDPTAEAIPDLDEPQMLEALDTLSTYETSNNMNDIARCSLGLTSILYTETTITREEAAKYVPTFVNIVKELVAKWTYFGYYLSGTIRYNVEYAHQELSGHPDIVTDQCILDVKNTTSFQKMSKESFLQVLAYYALNKAMNPETPVSYIGFVLPMQRDLIVFDVSGWNSSPYLQVLISETTKLIPQVTPTEMPTEIMQMIVAAMAAGIMPEVPVCKPGGHIHKGKDIAKTLQDFATKFPGRPCQLFLSNTHSGKRDARTATQVDSAAAVVRAHNLQFFVHAPYMINLCANECDEKGEFWQQRILNEELILASRACARAVVVHTGARKTKTEEEALTIMEHMVRTALSYASESCKLLLESPCGKGSEIVTRPEELGAFFRRFSTEEKKRLGLCLDTCHVFAAGYDPLEYLKWWEQYMTDIPIVLIHFNDSKTPCGSHVDRHARIGTGHIGYDKLMEVAAWAHHRGIPLVQE